ncbi:GGDEF domain-containing protein [Streptomyces sp. NP160]|uniref:GGDEF domain-containing protein n=1 Tax=Streptomyces sp. NP160 TaxID=2586637 RepID=UPI0011191457|nr:GGDEF domain-containing protein [Streptomyces sp. NP160]TNM67876.1 GGDEF domain-containing protein [Streptomyces sp. NP160]
MERPGGAAGADCGADRALQPAEPRPSRVLVVVFSVGLAALVVSVVVAAVQTGSAPGAWPWPVVVALWTAFLGLRHDAAQRWMAGGDLRRRTARRVVFGQVLGSLALVSCALPTLVPLACLLVAGVHVEWRWRRALEAGALAGTVLSVAVGAGVEAGVLHALRGATEQAAALGLSSLVLTNVAILARQREGSKAALARAERSRHAELLHAAQHDALTGLLGRRGTAEALTTACAAASSQSLAAVVFCDLDGFKPVNDQHGHEVGDRVLVEVAHRLRQAAGPTAQVGRTGGDEFVVVLPAASGPAAVQSVAERVRACLDEPLVVDGLVLALGLSAGTAACDAPAPAEELLRRADAAMYAVKARRREERGDRSGTRPAVVG